jgi:hypothetical protein
VLPGVTVTLTGTDRTATFVTGSDGRYRFLNVAPGTYKITAEMSGFTTLAREAVVVVGANVELPFTMRVGTRQENVTVEGTSPIVDAKATGTATNFTQDELSKIPTSRDPWALLRTVPGVQMDRVNIAGNETGQQSNFASKGSSRYDTVWTMDGVVITDMSATGGLRLLRFRRLPGDSDLNVGSGPSSTDRRRGLEPRREARHEPISRHDARATPATGSKRPTCQMNWWRAV